MNNSLWPWTERQELDNLWWVGLLVWFVQFYRHVWHLRLPLRSDPQQRHSTMDSPLWYVQCMLSPPLRMSPLLWHEKWNEKETVRKKKRIYMIISAFTVDTFNWHHDWCDFLPLVGEFFRLNRPQTVSVNHFWSAEFLLSYGYWIELGMARIYNHPFSIGTPLYVVVSPLFFSLSDLVSSSAINFIYSVCLLISLCGRRPGNSSAKSRCREIQFNVYPTVNRKHTQITNIYTRFIQ